MKKKNHIEFEPIAHKYRNTETDANYTGVTTWIGNHKHAFDGSTVATQKRLGLTHEQVLELWAENNRQSTIRGTWIHNSIEDYLFHKILPDTNNQYYTDFPLDYLNTLLKKRCKLIIEDILYCDRRGLAGQSDLVLEYKSHIEIEDWKTNKKDTEKFMKVEWYTKKFKALFTDLYETSYNEYAIQLVLYGMMAEEYYGKPCKKFTINHLYNGFTQIEIDKKTVKYIRSKLKFLFN